LFDGVDLREKFCCLDEGMDGEKRRESL